ncbi:hypothetical protein NNO_0819 [Hydrogenimonas sp.]|nr:hypothetical protein NNO_0819 [Hydrogenimonas sp.]
MSAPEFELKNTVPAGHGAEESALFGYFAAPGPAAPARFADFA